MPYLNCCSVIGSHPRIGDSKEPLDYAVATAQARHPFISLPGRGHALLPSPHEDCPAAPTHEGVKQGASDEARQSVRLVGSLVIAKACPRRDELAIMGTKALRHVVKPTRDFGANAQRDPRGSDVSPTVLARLGQVMDESVRRRQGSFSMGFCREDSFGCVLTRHSRIVRGHPRHTCDKKSATRRVCPASNEA